MCKNGFRHNTTDFYRILKLNSTFQQRNQRLQTKTLTEIYDNVFCSSPAVVEDLLYPGMYLLAGDSKIGKSFLVSQIAFHVATGKDFWERHVQQGEVLYLALEDHYARISRCKYIMSERVEAERKYW